MDNRAAHYSGDAILANAVSITTTNCITKNMHKFKHLDPKMKLYSPIVKKQNKKTT